MGKETKRRRKRKGGKPLGVHYAKLSVPDGLIPEDRVARWFNDNDNRIQRAIDNDWEFVTSSDNSHVGDGSTDSGRDVEHTYKSPGSYKVILIVTDDMGGESTATMEIEIEEDSSSGEDDLFWYIVAGLSLLLLAIIGLLFVGRKIYE